MPFDIEKMNKLPPEARFLDINNFWYFPNRWVVRFLYPLPVTPTQITITSLIAGLVLVSVVVLLDMMHVVNVMVMVVDVFLHQ